MYEKTTRSKVLEKLNVSDEILSTYEKELELSRTGNKVSEFDDEDLKSLEILHKLKKSGFSYSEIKLYSTFAEILNGAEFKDIYEIKSLQRLSPVSRLKESNSSSINEISELKAGIQAMEERLEKALEENSTKLKDKEEEISSLIEKNKDLTNELNAKEDALTAIHKRLQESLTFNSEIEAKLSGLKSELDAKQVKISDIEQKAFQYENELTIKQKALETLDLKLSASMSDKSKFESQVAPIKAELQAKNQAFESLDKQLSEALLQKSKIESELATARVELDVAKNARKDLEEYNTRLKADAEIKQKTFETLDRDLSDAIVKKSNLEAELSAYKEGKIAPDDVKGKRSKELYELLVKRELEAKNLQSENQKLKNQLNTLEKETEDLKDQADILEGGMEEIEEEIATRYKKQISTLKAQVEGLMDKKQKEWEEFYKTSNERHQNEITALQKKHTEDIRRLSEELTNKNRQDSVKNSGLISNLINRQNKKNK